MTALGSGTRLGPYEIVSRIGVGGMGEVWRATDTRLQRSVAIKVLPAELAQNAQLQVRFEREAKAISQLNHPNICTLHDIGHENGISFLVMELLEGESLADRLRKGPLTLGELLRAGAQIADALDRAHRAGIVHRDLKPGNVMLTKSGAKLLDFGLAKSIAAVRVLDPDEKTALHDSKHPLTAEGTIVGTFQYMAPEQLEGSEADARTDIFALGAVLYEMATGRRAFDGKTRTSLIAAIVSGQPEPIRSLQPLTPAALEHVVDRALQKDPEDRWQNVHDIAAELRWIAGGGSQVSGAALPARRRISVPWSALTALLLIAAAALAVVAVRQKARADRVLVADIAPPQGTELEDFGDNASPPVLSPDGRYVVFAAVDAKGRRLWLRDLVTGETRALNGTDDASFAFWSPDSRNIGFFIFGSLKRIDITGGAPVQLAPVLVARGGAWAPDGTIIYAPSTLAALMRVPAAGGASRPLTAIDHTRHTSHRWPSFLPDGDHFVYLAANHRDTSGGSNAVYIASLKGGAPRLLMTTPGNAAYAAGYLLFVRDTTLYAQKISDDGQLSGDAKAVLPGVLNDRGIWRGGFSAIGSDLLYCSGQASHATQLVWLDRAGKLLSVVADQDRYWDVQLSPDQTKILTTAGDPLRQLWVIDLARNTRTRLDFGAPWVGVPAWHPNGASVYASVVFENSSALIEKQIAGGNVRTILSAPPQPDSNAIESTISPDGKRLVYGVGWRLWSAPTDRPQEAVPLTAAATRAHNPAFSPDGRWIAYVATESEHDDVFVARIDDFSQKWQISEAGGAQPRWRADGKEIFYNDLKDHLTAVTFDGHEPPQIGKPETLPIAIAHIGIGSNYDVAANGQRFIVRRVAGDTWVPVKLMTNWKKVLDK